MDQQDDQQPAPLLQWVKATQKTFHNLTVKKYGLPDKTVASQLLMYRQLLHTACKPTLKLTRPYQGTPAQVAVRHQPWWSQTVENGVTQTMVETGQMVIRYDNLITRLWNSTRVAPPGSQVDTTTMPPIPHDDWIHKLGFQQADPVTDFRSGGILSLALMVWIVESCPTTFARFCEGGDAEVLPFGITSINITDLLAKFLLLSKQTDRMEALLSQKPFWQMFADPSAILACQSVAMDMLADVVVELNQQNTTKVTVFDFAKILKITEHRVEYDLLGAGPMSVQELKRTYQQLRRKYKAQLERKLNSAVEEPTEKKLESSMRGLVGAVADKMASAKIVDQAGKVAGQASVATGSILSNVVAQGTNLSKAVMNKAAKSPTNHDEVATADDPDFAKPSPIQPQEFDLLDGDWTGTANQTDEGVTTTAVDTKFQIGDDDEDDFLL